MMHTKTFTLGLMLSLSIAAFGTSERHAADKDEGSKKPRQSVVDQEITNKTADLGNKLFFGGLSGTGSNFKERYEQFGFEGKKLHEAINEIKPRKEEDEAPSVDQEMPIARAIADMFDEMTPKEAPAVVAEIAKAKDKIKKTPTSDTQYDELVKRLWDAAQLKVPKELWPEKVKRDEKKDERLASFREAFKQARDEQLDLAKRKNEEIKKAAAGNKEAQAKLFGDPKNKEDLKKNELAVGANVGNVILKKLHDDPASAMELMKALSKKDEKGNWKMNFNNADGKAVTMELPKFDLKNKDQFNNIFGDEKMKNAAFVGHDHPAESKPIEWAWDSTKKEVGKKEPPQVAAQGGTAKPAPSNAGSTQPANEGDNIGAAGAAGSQGARGTSGSGSGDVARGQSGFQNGCVGCHQRNGIGEVSAEAAERAMANGSMPKGGRKLSAQQQADIVAFLSSK